MSRTHNEKSQVNVTVRPFDLDGNPYVPTTAKYRVDDCKTEKELVGWTSIAVLSEEMTIAIPGTANAIIGSDRRTPESKIVTVVTDEGLVTQHYAEYLYRVKDLKFVNGS